MEITEMEYIPLRTLDDQLEAQAEWPYLKSPAERLFLEGVRRAKALGLIPQDKLV